MGNQVCRKQCYKNQSNSGPNQGTNEKYIHSKFKQQNKQKIPKDKRNSIDQSIVFTGQKIINPEEVSQCKVGKIQKDSNLFSTKQIDEYPNLGKKASESTSMLEKKATYDELPLHSKISIKQQNQESINSEIYQKMQKVPVQQIKKISIIQHIFKHPELQSNFESKLRNIAHHLSFGWRKLKSDSYINYIPGGRVYILAQDKLYKGWTKLNTLTPESSGKLITQQGYYEGYFFNGKANGIGRFKFKSFVYQGKWNNGQLIRGKIWYKDLKIYQGCLKNGVPDGYGLMIILNSRIVNNRKKYKQSSYYGFFQKGKFHGKGRYQCSEYIYEGYFAEGKKNGLGCLQLRQNNFIKSYFKSTKKVFQGQFQNDIFIKEIQL